MQIDDNFIKKTLPIEIPELNIHFGVFIGGLGDFSESYLDTVENYRGCISDVSKFIINQTWLPFLYTRHLVHLVPLATTSNSYII